MKKNKLTERQEMNNFETMIQTIDKFKTIIIFLRGVD